MTVKRIKKNIFIFSLNGPLEAIFGGVNYLILYPGFLIKYYPLWSLFIYRKNALK